MKAGIIALLIGLGILAAAQEPIVDVDFSRTGNPLQVNATGVFEGVLPVGSSENYTQWNSSDVKSSFMEEDGRRFIRFNVLKSDKRTQFQLSAVKLEVPGYYKAKVQARCPDSPMEVYVRQLLSPYREFWNGSCPRGDGWTERELYFSLERKASPFSDALPDVSNIVPYMALGEGTTDIASIKLFKSDRESYLAAKSSGVRRAEKGLANFFRNSRFPLGPQSGWNAPAATAGLVSADASADAPSGAPALKISSTAVFSEPFQTDDPKGSNYIRFAYRSEVAGWVSVVNGGASRALSPSKEWKVVVMEFKADPLANAFSVSFSAKGNLWLDSLMAKSGTAPDAYASAGDCEIALAAVEGELPGTRIQFADEATKIKYCATGKLDGALMKGKVVNIYGVERMLPALALNTYPAGEIDYGAIFKDATLGVFRVEVWAERDGRRISPFNEIVMNRMRRPVYWGKDAPDSPFGGHFRPADARIMKAAGINWERLHDSCLDGTCWGWLETEKGKWTFADGKIDAYRKANLKILGFIGSAPVWASYNPGIKHKYIGFTYFYQPKDEEAFRNYVRTVVGRYKGVIDEWQFQNEPWSAGFWHKGYNKETGKFEAGDKAADDYAAWSKIAYEEMKKTDPGSKMYGFNSYGGTGGDKWTRDVYKSGAYPYCDMIDYHYYNGAKSLDCLPGDSTSLALQGAIGYLKLKAPVPLKPVVMSEGNATRSGTIPEDLSGADDYSGLYKHTIPWIGKDDNLQLADMTCRYVISHLTLGVKRVFLYSDHTYRHLLMPPCFPVLLSSDGYPHPIMTAFSNMAWLLEDRKFVKCVPAGENVWSYIFEGRGKTVAVISGKANGRYSFQPADDIEVLDLFGNSIKGPVKYEGRIFYLESTKTVAELETALLKR